MIAVIRLSGQAGIHVGGMSSEESTGIIRVPSGGGREPIWLKTLLAVGEARASWGSIERSRAINGFAQIILLGISVLVGFCGAVALVL